MHVGRSGARAFCSGALAAAAARTSRESPFSEHFICKNHYVRAENAVPGAQARRRMWSGKLQIARNAYSRSGVGQLYVRVRVYVAECLISAWGAPFRRTVLCAVSAAHVHQLKYYIRFKMCTVYAGCHAETDVLKCGAQQVCATVMHFAAGMRTHVDGIANDLVPKRESSDYAGLLDSGIHSICRSQHTGNVNTHTHAFF